MLLSDHKMLWTAGYGGFVSQPSVNPPSQRDQTRRSGAARPLRMSKQPPLRRVAGLLYGGLEANPP
jgi:hypothetical protein